MLEAIKFEHTIFALPFAYIAMVLAAGGWPGWWTVGWVTANLCLGCWFADPELLCACMAYVRPANPAS